MTRKDKYSFVIDVRKYINKESPQPLKRYSVRLCLQLFVGGIMSYLRYFSLLVHSVLCFCFCFSSSCCQFLWIVLFSNVYLRNHRSFKYELCTSISQFSYQNPVFVDNNTTAHFKCFALTISSI
jgi:hypothetical protein